MQLRDRAGDEGGDITVGVSAGLALEGWPGWEVHWVQAGAPPRPHYLPLWKRCHFLCTTYGYCCCVSRRTVLGEDVLIATDHEVCLLQVASRIRHCWLSDPAQWSSEVSLPRLIRRMGTPSRWPPFDVGNIAKYFKKCHLELAVRTKVQYRTQQYRRRTTRPRECVKEHERGQSAGNLRKKYQDLQHVLKRRCGHVSVWAWSYAQNIFSNIPCQSHLEIFYRLVIKWNFRWINLYGAPYKWPQAI